MFSLLLLAAASAAASTPPEPLSLACPGQAEHHFIKSQSLFWVTNGIERFVDQIDVVIDGANSRARVPRRMIPAAHGGKEGWFEIHELVMTDDVITGVVPINFANHPKLRIDRRNGLLSLDGGLGNFTGQCRKVDPGEHAF